MVAMILQQRHTYHTQSMTAMHSAAKTYHTQSMTAMILQQRYTYHTQSCDCNDFAEKIHVSYTIHDCNYFAAKIYKSYTILWLQWICSKDIHIIHNPMTTLHTAAVKQIRFIALLYKHYSVLTVHIIILCIVLFLFTWLSGRTLAVQAYWWSSPVYKRLNT